MLLRFFTLWMLAFFLLCGCQRDDKNEVQGYIEGRYTYMASPVSGVLQRLFIERGQFVKRGTKLLSLEQQPESDAYLAAQQNLQQAIASRDAISANLTYAKLTYERYRILVPKRAIEQSALDNAKSNYEATLAQLAEANATIASSTAQLAQSKWTKEQKTLYAPVDAIVFDIFYRLGEYTEANEAIVSLLSPNDIKAIFYVYEPELSKLKLQDKVSVICDGCPRNIKAHISFISPTAEYTPPVIYSNQTNAKLIFRIEAEFNKQDAINMHPGQPVTIVYSHG